MSVAPMQEREPNCRLLTLGRLTLLTPRGEDDDLAKRRRKLALLTVLALSPRPLSRDTLVDMFWGEEPEERARHSLSDALSHLRRVIGKEAISARQADIELSPDARLTVDARAFSEACQAQDWERAIDLYGGPFLDGMIIDRSARFEQWSAQVRERLQRLFVRACAARCATLAASGDWSSRVVVAERWLEAAPESEDAAQHLADARRLADAIESARPAPEQPPTEPTTESTTAPPAVPAAAIIAPVLAPTAALPVASARWGRRGRVAAAATILVAGSAIAWSATHARERASAVPSRPVVVVTNIRNTLGDTSAAWLGEGLRQMLAAGLDRGGRIAVVPPLRLRDALARRGAPSGSVGTTEELEIAHALGAGWAVRGNVTRGDGVYVLDIAVDETNGGPSLGTFSVTGQSLIGVADQAVSRIRSLVTRNVSGPYYADVETASEEAFQQFVRAQQANAEGRYAEGARALDAAIALDSTFPSAIMERLRLERANPRTPTFMRLAALYERAKPRVSDWDRLEQATYYAFHNGEHGRAERLASDLVERYPFDPRAYVTLADVLAHHGKWSAADSVYRRLLALDSLAIASGTGPCVPCEAFSGLVNVRVIDGDLAGAEVVARRWVSLQPDLPKAWSELATVLSFEARFDSGLEAERRAVALSNGEPEFEVRLGRMLIMARRFTEAEATIASMERRGGALSENAYDLRVTLLRERAQHRAALAVMERQPAGNAVSDLLGSQTYGLLGQTQVAVDRYERFLHPRVAEPEPVSPTMSVAGDVARGWSWTRALEADAIWPTADTVRLRALADSIQRISSRSYYGRDWGLHHHVLGLVALRAGHYDEAMRELSLARWGVSGWTRTLAAYADAALAAKRPADALAALRDAYRGPLDAMGRYLPRSEIDYRMAITFGALGMRDSAETYAGYVRTAWRDADPEWKHRLEALGTRISSR